jgi:transposase InsO family protein
MTAELATSALQMALDKHRKPLIIHSDMGSQYTSAEFNIKCQNYGLKHSYSLKGHPYDNGRMEAFHSILKREEVYLKAYLKDNHLPNQHIRLRLQKLLVS